VTAIPAAEVLELVGRWWWNYDEAQFDVLTDLLTDDAQFTCRTDTGKTDYEEFVNADISGRDDVMAWQREHRLDSPYPLRHNGTDVHITERRNNEADFASYIFVTQIVDGAVSNLSTAIVRGTVRHDDGTLRLAALHVTLDTQNSTTLRER
jgi:SnoaL-like domain